jgi:hypothetical protein
VRLRKRSSASSTPDSGSGRNEKVPRASGAPSLVFETTNELWETDHRTRTGVNGSRRRSGSETSPAPVPPRKRWAHNSLCCRKRACDHPVPPDGGQGTSQVKVVGSSRSSRGQPLRRLDTPVVPPRNTPDDKKKNPLEIRGGSPPKGAFGCSGTGQGTRNAEIKTPGHSLNENPRDCSLRRYYPDQVRGIADLSTDLSAGKTQLS